MANRLATQISLSATEASAYLANDPAVRRAVRVRASAAMYAASLNDGNVTRCRLVSETGALVDTISF